MCLKVVFFILSIFILQITYSNANLASLLGVGPECISLFELIRLTRIACENRDNASLWQAIIDCHDPISEQVFCLHFIKFSLCFQMKLYKTWKKWPWTEFIGIRIIVWHLEFHPFNPSTWYSIWNLYVASWKVVSPLNQCRLGRRVIK